MTFRCTECNSPDVLVILPGSEPEIFGMLTIARGEPMRYWCEPCARAAGWPWVESER